MPICIDVCGKPVVSKRLNSLGLRPRGREQRSCEGVVHRFNVAARGNQQPCNSLFRAHAVWQTATLGKRIAQLYGREGVRNQSRMARIRHKARGAARERGGAAKTPGLLGTKQHCCKQSQTDGDGGRVGGLLPNHIDALLAQLRLVQVGGVKELCGGKSKVGTDVPQLRQVENGIARLEAGVSRLRQTNGLGQRALLETKLLASLN